MRAVRRSRALSGNGVGDGPGKRAGDYAHLFHHARDAVEARAEVGKRLREWRKRADLTYRVAAEQIGVSQAWVTHAEIGNFLPGRERIPLIVRAYGLSDDERAELEDLCGPPIARGTKPTKPRTEFGTLLNAFRERAGVSKSDLARACGVNPEAVYSWEHGKLPLLERLGIVAQVLGLSPDEVDVLSGYYASSWQRRRSPRGEKQKMARVRAARVGSRVVAPPQRDRTDPRS